MHAIGEHVAPSHTTGTTDMLLSTELENSWKEGQGHDSNLLWIYIYVIY